MDRFEIADDCRDGGTYIGKDGKRYSYERTLGSWDDPGSKGDGCLIRLPVLAMPVALMALLVRGKR